MNARPVVLLAVALALAAPHAAAAFRSAPYVAGSPVGGVGVQCNNFCLPNGPSANLGGYEFPANGETPLLVFVIDTAPVGVYVHACQDADDDGFCGEAGEPVAHGCGDGVALERFSPALNTHVFVYSVRVFGDPCLGAATTGLVTLVSERR